MGLKDEIESLTDRRPHSWTFSTENGGEATVWFDANDSPWATIDYDVVEKLDTKYGVESVTADSPGRRVGAEVAVSLEEL
jgi:hypothetical protein